MIKPSNVFEKKIEELFSKKNDTDTDLILRIVSIILYSSSNNTDLIELYNLVDIDIFIKVLSLFEDRNIKFPSKEILKETILLALLYFYKEIEGKSWERIKKEFPFEISSISYGIKIKNLNNFIKQRLEEIARKQRKQRGIIDEPENETGDAQSNG